ncbi:hypothetical protein SGPA1_41023 [Streptomyces misionensis JCM 4497]
MGRLLRGAGGRVRADHRLGGPRLRLGGAARHGRGLRHARHPRRRRHPAGLARGARSAADPAHRSDTGLPALPGVERGQRAPGPGRAARPSRRPARGPPVLPPVDPRLGRAWLLPCGAALSHHEPASAVCLRRRGEAHGQAPRG